VQGSLDGAVGQAFLVTSTGNLISNLLDGTLNRIESLVGIKSIEPDQLLPIPQKPISNIPRGLNDRTPVNYFGALVWHGYAAQPAAQIIRLTFAQNGFNVSGAGIVAVIDTGVDTPHLVLQSVLLPGYDFMRNQPGASEWLDVPQLQNGGNNDSDDEGPVVVQQSGAAVPDQSSAAVLDGGPYFSFGHGTMTTGLVHLVAPKAKILPLKAFTSIGTGYISNIVTALYYAVHQQANVVNMSFDVSTPSAALSQAAAGNENTSDPTDPAALNGTVMGIASTTDWDSRSSFSNFGNTDVWLPLPASTRSARSLAAPTPALPAPPLALHGSQAQRRCS
jgi:hypothetical protein